MPLNKLENFIKNTEGKILYVNPNDIDATDSITNQGNSLAQPFKTIQRALLESARFSYVEGNNNDLIEKTTILLFPGEHVIDNRPGFAVKSVSNTATAVSPAGAESTASETLSLNLTSNFDRASSNASKPHSYADSFSVSGELGDNIFESKYIAIAIPAPITMNIKMKI